jgi:hypothetical protein
MDPAVRFSKRYGVNKKLFNELWRRKCLLEYDNEGLCGFFLFKTNRRIDVQAMGRWMDRTEVYCKAQHVIKMGVQTVDSNYFGKYEGYVLEELMRHMKNGEAKSNKSIL